MTIATKLRQLAAAALMACAPAAHAALTYNDGDLILGFRAATGEGSNSCYEVNLGQYTNLIGVANGFTVVIPGNILTDIETTFGPDWKTRGDVFWSVSGVQYTAATGVRARTIFASKAEANAGTQSVPWTRVTASTQQPVALRVQALGTPGYSAGTFAGPPGQTESINCNRALIQSNSVGNSYTSHMPGGVNSSAGAAYGHFNGGIENNFAEGTSKSVIDFYMVQSAENVGQVGTPSTFLGAFRLDDSGVLTFSPNPSDFAGATEVKLASATLDVGENAANATITVLRSGNATTAFTVNLSTANGTAIAGTDYTAFTNFAVPFAVDELSKNVNIPVVDVPGFQGDRTFTATIAVASGTATAIDPSTTTVTIKENDPPPTIITLSAATYSVSEDAGQATITVTRSLGVGSLSVNFSTQDGTAVAGTNYTGQTNTVVDFGDGETSKPVNVLITDTVGFTGNLTFNVTLSNPTNGASIGVPGTATVTIQDTDTSPSGQISFSAAAYQVASKNALGQPNTIVLTLNRANGTVGAVSADVSYVVAGSNLDTLDFTFTSPTTVNFADGQASTTLNIPLLVGAAPLPGVIKFHLGNPTGGATVTGIVDTTVNVTAPDKVAPKLVVTTPKAGKSGAVFNVTGSVTDPDPIARVELQLNGGPVVLANVTGSAFAFNNMPAENGLNTLTVQAFDTNGTGSLVKKITFTYVNERPQFVGSFNGIAGPTAVAPPAGDLNNASGLVTVTVSKTGAFTGKVTIGGAVLPIKGVFANDGAARFAKALGGTYTLVKKGKVPVQFGDLTLHIARVTVPGGGGPVEVSRITGGIGLTSVIECDRAAFDGKTSLVDPAVLANKGKYTCVLPAKPQAVLTPSQFPQGNGIGVITILKTGKVTFVGSLADGTPVVSSSALSAFYTAPFYAALYSKKGSIAGNLAVGVANLLPDADISTEELLWVRPADAKAKYYPAGWSGGVFVDFFAASYNGAKQNPPASVFPLINPSAGATMEFRDGTLGALKTHDVLISPINKVTNVPATDKTYKLTIVSGTGALLGNFTHDSNTTKPAFKGIIYQKGALKGGYGYFLSVVPKGGPSGQGGSVKVIPKP